MVLPELAHLVVECDLWARAEGSRIVVVVASLCGVCSSVRNDRGQQGRKKGEEATPNGVDRRRGDVRSLMMEPFG